MTISTTTMANSPPSFLAPSSPRGRSRAFSVSSHHSDLFSDAGPSTHASPESRAVRLPTIDQEVARRSSSSKRTLTETQPSSSMHPTQPLKAEDLPLSPNFGSDPYTYAARPTFEGLSAGDAEGLVSARTSRRPSAIDFHSRSPSRPRSREQSPFRGAVDNLRSRASSRRGSVSKVDSPLSRRQGWAPQLIDHNLFLPLPKTDPLQTLLNKYVAPNMRPMRDMEGRWDGMTVESMVASSSWRCLAVYGRDMLLRSDPSDVAGILKLWHIRFHALAMLHLNSQLYSEITAVFRHLSHLPIPPDAIPFELEVMKARSRAYRPLDGSVDRDYLGAVEELGVLINRCKREARRGLGRSVLEGGNDEGRTRWRERAMSVGIILAGVLVEMRDYPAAIALLAPLLDEPATPELIFYLLSIHLTASAIGPAQVLLTKLQADPAAPEPLKLLGQALFDCAEGNWEDVVTCLRKIQVQDNAALDVIVANNLAVALVNSGRLHDATDVLERMLERSPATSLTEPVIFNLATLYELQAGSATPKKVSLLLETAKWHGDGLKPGCLKLA